MHSALRRVVNLFGGKPQDTPAAPLDSLERARLAHRRRLLARELRQRDKALRVAGCSGCLRQEPGRGAVALVKRAEGLRAELAQIDRRLANP